MVDVPIHDVIDKIVELTQAQAEFWSQSHGWAPRDAAELLNRSRLDRQVDLTRCLRIWFQDSIDEPSEGKLILAWANLGALVEGTLKLMLAVYLKEYRSDVDRLQQRDGTTVEPDSAMLEKLRVFFARKIWIKGDQWDDWIRFVQERRNAIHHFKDRNLGNWSEFEANVKAYLCFVSDVNSRLPYPDDFPVSMVLTDSSWLQTDECIRSALNSGKPNAVETFDDALDTNDPQIR